MKIVFLDRDTVGYDVNTDIIKNEGKVIEYNITSKSQVNERIADAEIIITNKVVIGKDEMVAAPNLKLICLAATGYNNIDVAEAVKRGIIVANVKSYSTEAVAQSTFAMILTLMNSVREYDKSAKNGEWSSSPIFTLLKYPVVDLFGKKIGIIGYGTIGKRVADIARAFGMEVIAAKRKNAEYTENFRRDFDDVMKESDIITIHTPLSESTKDMIGEKEFSLMKKEAIIINTARGGIINEEALYNALKNKQIKGAGLDVMAVEPPSANHPLLSLDNVVIMPHVAWASTESRQRLVDGIAENIRKFRSGKGLEIMVK